MALNTWKCNHLMQLPFIGLKLAENRGEGQSTEFELFMSIVARNQ